MGQSSVEMKLSSSGATTPDDFCGLMMQRKTDNYVTNRPGKTQCTLFGFDPQLEKVNTTKFDKLDYLPGLAFDTAFTSFIERHAISRLDEPPDRSDRHVNLHVDEIETERDSVAITINSQLTLVLELLAIGCVGRSSSSLCVVRL